MKVVKTRQNFSAYLFFIFKSVLYLFSQSYDLVHAYYGFHSSLFPAIIKRKPLIITFVGSDAFIEPSRSKLYRFLQTFVVSRADQIIAVSNQIKDHLVSNLCADASKISVITFGINFVLFKPIFPDLARSELGLPLNKKLVLFPACPSREVKRFDVFHRAIELLQKGNQNILPVIMSNNKRPYSEIPLIMNACDVLVLTSDSEGSPTVIKEAMACNLPIVSVNVGDVAEILKDTPNSHICRQDPADIAEKIALALNDGRKMNLHKSIMHLSSESIAVKILTLYRKTIKESL